MATGTATVQGMTTVKAFMGWVNGNGRGDGCGNRLGDEPKPFADTYNNQVTVYGGDSHI